MVDNSSLILSKSAYAVRCGVGVSTVSQWIKRGHLSGAALTADGRVDVAEADRQLGDRLDVSRSIGKQVSAGHESDDLPLAPVVAAPLGEMQAIKLEQAKRQLQRDREDDLARRGLYTPTDEAKRAQARELSTFLSTVETRFPELIGLLTGKNGKEAVTIARRWWRALRQSESEAALERASGFTEFVVDAEARHAA